MSKPPRFNWKTTDGAEHEFDITAAEIAIGRAPTCDIVLADDQMVSRRHAVVRRQGNTCTLVDLGSSNGTLVNGVEIHDATILRENDRVTIGDHDLLFYEAKEDAVPVAASPVPASAWAPPVAAPAFGFDAAVAARDTGAVEQVSSSFGQSHNGQDAPRDDFAARYQDQTSFNGGYGSNLGGWGSPAPAQSAPASTPAAGRQDAASLLATIQTLYAQLQDQVASTNESTDKIRAGIRSTLTQLDAALRAAQSTAQQSAILDLQQLATNVSQSPLVDQVANFARRAGEVRDVLTAHQTLLSALESVRDQLEQIANN